MTVTVTHKKISTKPPRTDNPALVGSSDWNDTHTVTGLGDFVLGFATKAAVQAATIDFANVLWIRTAGYTTPGDKGDGLYAWVGSQPSHAGKIQSADGSWWELRETAPRPQQFGAIADGTDSLDGWQSTPIKSIKGDWVTATSYSVNDLVWDASVTVTGTPKRYGYRCLINHTSGTFATDLAAGKWVLGAFSGTDNTTALKNCWGYSAAKANGYMSIPPGVYRLGDAIAAANVYNTVDQILDMSLSAAGCEIVGAGRNTSIFLIDEDVDWSVSNSYNRTLHALFGNAALTSVTANKNVNPTFRFRSIGVRGRWLHRPGGNNGGADSPNWIGPNFCHIEGARELTVQDCHITDIRGKAMRNFFLNNFVATDNRMERCARGFIMSRNSGDALVSRNILSHCDDDAIDIQTSDSSPTSNFYNTATNTRAPAHIIVTDNKIIGTETAVLVPASNVRVANNTCFLIHTGGVGIGVGSSNAPQPAKNVAIIGNTLIDTVCRFTQSTQSVSSNNSTNDGIITFYSNGRSIVDTTTYPGDWDSVSAFISEYSSNRAWTLDGTTTTGLRSAPRGKGVVISGNQVLRTLPSGIAYSAWGFGLQFNQTGWVDGTYNDANFISNGLLVDDDQRGVSIMGNNFDGLPGSGILFRAPGSLKRIDAFKNVVVMGNTFTQLGRAGIMKDTSGAAVDHWQIKIIGNKFDIDPMMTNANRTGTAGKWSNRAATDPIGAAIWLYQMMGGEILHNDFMNCQIPAEYTSGSVYEDGNVVYGEPASATTGYNANNVGVGTMPLQDGYAIIVKNSTPGNANYDKFTNTPTRYVQSTAASNAVTLTSPNAANVITLSLPGPGVWEVSGMVIFAPAATTNITVLQCGISQTSATLPTPNDNTQSRFANFYAAFVPGAVNFDFSLAPCRITVFQATNVFLVAQATFTVAGLTVGGRIQARLIT